jgi:MFS family permease
MAQGTRHQERLPRSLLVLMAHAVITQGSIFILRPTISYRAIEIGIDSTTIGLLAGTYTLLPLVVAIQMGRASDRLGERRLMVAGNVGMVLAGGVLLLAGRSFTGLIVASILLGVAHLGTAIGQQSTVAQLVPRSRLSAGYAYYTLTGSLGQALAPGLIALFGASQTIPDTQAIFAVTIGLLCVALVVPVFLPRDAPRAPRSETAGGSVGTLLRIRGLPSAVVISGIVLAAIDVFTVYLPVLGAERGYTAGLVSLLLVIRAVASVVSRILLEPLELRFGANRLLLGTVLLAFGVMAVLPAVTSVPALAVLMVPLGLGLGLAQPITMAWIAAIAPVGVRGRAMSLRLTGNRLAQTLIPVIAGSVAGPLGMRGVLWTVALFLAGAAASASRVDTTTRPAG